jgi:hypothetical protein
MGHSRYDYGKTSLMLAAGATALLVASQAQAQTRKFDVPAQPAATGIPQFGKQADLQILAPQAVVKGKRVNACTAPIRCRTGCRACCRAATWSWSPTTAAPRCWARSPRPTGLDRARRLAQETAPTSPRPPTSKAPRSRRWWSPASAPAWAAP